MKIKNYIKRSLACMAILLSLVTVSCTDHFDELNTPRAQLTVEQMDKSMIGFAFAEAQHFGMRAWYQGNNLFAGEYSQFHAIIHPNFASANFNGPGSWLNLLMEGFYSNTAYGAAANQLDLVLKNTLINNLKPENALAKIWKVALYQRQTDYFGPIIYSNFGNGKTSVAFDSQKDIYFDFFKILDEAAADLRAANPATKIFPISGSSHDLVYDGNVLKNLKFLNSLRLRLAIRISYIEPAKAKLEAEKAASAPEGFIVSNADNALSKVKIDGTNVNKLSTITYISEFVLSSTLASLMNGYQDPRLPVYTQPCCGRLTPSTAVFGGLVGFRNGFASAQRGNNLDLQYSYVGKRWLPINNGGTNEPDHIMEAAEVFFLRAEGALRGWNMGGTAQFLYNEGIKASIKFRTTASDAVVDAYVNSTNTPSKPLDRFGNPDSRNSPPVTDIPVRFETAGSFERQLEQIITQKWLALFPMNDTEAWAERRRTGYPRGYAIIQSDNPALTRTQLARRLIYPPNSYSTNKAATDAALVLLGGPDTYATRLWWDAKPLAAFPTPTD
ncbi:MAG: SusD/RagB family nutrient-binding outer membrane lipoprotein [Sphingobacterium thalpophilum]